MCGAMISPSPAARLGSGKCSRSTAAAGQGLSTAEVPGLHCPSSQCHLPACKGHERSASSHGPLSSGLFILLQNSFIWNILPSSS